MTKITAESASHMAEAFPKFRDIMDDIYEKIRDNAHYGSKRLHYILERPLDYEVFHKVSGELHENNFNIANIKSNDGSFVEEFDIYYLKNGA